MSLNLASTMITFRQTVAPKNYDPELGRDNQNSHATITYTRSAIRVRTSRGMLEGILDVKFTQLLRMSLYRCTHRQNVFLL